MKTNVSSKYQQGGVLLFSLAMLLLAVIVFLVSITAQRHVTLQTRLNHGAENALTIVAREGVGISDLEANYLAKTFIIYNLPMGVRSGDLRRTSQVELSLSSLGYEDTITLKVNQSAKQFLPHLPSFVSSVERKIARFYPTTETALVLDLSASMSSTKGGVQSPSEQMPGILQNFVESLMGEQDISKDHHIGFVPYSAYVNLGEKYANRLIKPSSRAIPPNFDFLRTMYNYQHDFLHNFGVERSRKGACVDYTNVTIDNVSELSKIPTSNLQGYDLVVDRYDIKVDGREVFVSTEDLKDRNPNGIPLDFLPVIQVDPDNPLKYVRTPTACPPMRLHEVSADQSSLRSEAARYHATHTTGGSEGIIWGWRLLLDSWQSVIWKDPKYDLVNPKKQMIVFTDGENNKGVEKEEFPSFLANICEHFISDNISFTPIIFDQGVSNQELSAYKSCSEKSGGSYFYVEGDDLGKLKVFFAKLGIRQYKTKFIH